MTQKKNEQKTSQSRRQFLEQLGGVGGSAAVYQAMVTMGLLVPGDSKAATNKANWQEKAALFASGPKPSVAVLGAGIAGLCVAYELKQAGFPVTVIEPRDRPGGLSHNLRAGSILQETDSQQVCGFASGEDMYFNAGPARISQHHANLLNYCSELKVPLQAFVNDNRGAYIHSASAFGGKPVRSREVIAAMRGNISQLLAKAMNAGALDDEFSASERAFVLEVLKDHGALNAFFQFAGTTRGGLASGSGGLNPAVPATPLERNDVMLDANIAFVPSFVEGYNQAATMMQPVGGMDRIAYAFAEQLQAEIFYGAEVSGIFRTGTGFASKAARRLNREPWKPTTSSSPFRPVYYAISRMTSAPVFSQQLRRPSTRIPPRLPSSRHDSGRKKSKSTAVSAGRTPIFCRSGIPREALARTRVFLLAPTCSVAAMPQILATSALPRELNWRSQREKKCIPSTAPI